MGQSASTERSLERFVSSADDVTGKRIGIPQQKRIIAALKNSTGDDIPTLLKGLDTEKSNCDILQQCWTAAEKCYNSNSKKFTPANVARELHIALIAYVMEVPKPFYRTFNRLTRELTSEQAAKSFPYKNYYKLLLLAVTKINGEPSNVAKDLMVYRGVNGKLKVKEGEDIFFQQFTSTSRDLKSAQSFATGGGTLFVIEGLVTSSQNAGTDLHFVCLDHIPPLISQNQERECLVWTNEAFRVTQVLPEKDGIEYVYLKA